MPAFMVIERNLVLKGKLELLGDINDATRRGQIRDKSSAIFVTIEWDSPLFKSKKYLLKDKRIFPSQRR